MPVQRKPLDVMAVTVGHWHVEAVCPPTISGRSGFVCIAGGDDAHASLGERPTSTTEETKEIEHQSATRFTRWKLP